MTHLARQTPARREHIKELGLPCLDELVGVGECALASEAGGEGLLGHEHVGNQLVPKLFQPLQNRKKRFFLVMIELLRLSEMDLAVIDSNRKVFIMHQISKKTTNPKCRLFSKIELKRYMAAGVYLFEAHGPPPPPVTNCMNEYIPLYLFTQGKGGGGR